MGFAVTSSYPHRLADQMSARSKRPPRQQPKTAKADRARGDRRDRRFARARASTAPKKLGSRVKPSAFVGLSNVRFGAQSGKPAAPPLTPACSQNRTSKRGGVARDSDRGFYTDAYGQTSTQSLDCGPILPHSRAAGRSVEASTHNYNLWARFLPSISFYIFLHL